MLLKPSLVVCAMRFSLPQRHSQLPEWSGCSPVPVIPVPSSRILLCPAAWIPPPSLKVVGLLLCDVLACSGLMIPSRFASSAHFLCLLLLCVPRSLMQMSGRIFFEAETQGTVWVSPSQCDTAPFSWSNYHSPFRQLFTKFTFHMPVTSSSAFTHNLLSGLNSSVFLKPT